MAPEPGDADARLERAHELYRARGWGELVALLSPLARGELLARPVLGFYLADAWHRTGERDAALALLDELGPVTARLGNDRLSRDRLNLVGVLLFGLGRLSEAERAWRELMSASARAGDEDFVARANNNLGVIYTLLGDREAALAAYGRAITAYQRLGYLRGLAQAHQNKAITYREMDLWREADTHFLRAIDYALEDGSEDESTGARQERAVLLCYLGEARLAELTARHALREWIRLEDPPGIGDSHRVLATIALAEHRWEAAEREAGEGLAIAERVRSPLLEAEIHELLGALAEARRRPEEAASRRSRADALFGGMGAERWGAQYRRRMEWLATRV